jgi:Family of unknown function (DUF6228)
MDSFIIKAERQVVVTFDSQRFESDGWLDAYEVHLEAPDFKASAFVENPGFGHPPTVLFDDIAKQWSGWKGVKTWDAMEGELRRSATSDSTGHITIQFEVPGNSSTDRSNISAHADKQHIVAAARCMLRAGSLER